MKTETTTTTNQPTQPPIRAAAHDVFQCLLLDVWPGPAAVVDFGLKTEAHYGALQYAIKNHDVGPEELDEALGDGAAITTLIRDDNPYLGVKFTTPWDGIMLKVGDPPPKASNEKFAAGRLFASPPALEAIPKDDIIDALRRHLAGDWGDVTADDRAANDRAVEEGGPILSSYRSKEGQSYWIMTEADRSVTVVLMPEEF